MSFIFDGFDDLGYENLDRIRKTINYNNRNSLSNYTYKGKTNKQTNKKKNANNHLNKKPEETLEKSGTITILKN